jgi:hypothetical protein
MLACLDRNLSQFGQHLRDVVGDTGSNICELILAEDAKVKVDLWKRKRLGKCHVQGMTQTSTTGVN